VRRIALDIGSARIGVAVSDAGGRVATPLKVLDARSLGSDPSPLVRLVEEYEVVERVVVLPIGIDGREGPHARETRRVAALLTERLDVPVVFHDERLSSAEAERMMASQGVSERDRRGSVDMVAASIILQGYLDSRRAGEDDDR
jgi:putative Holliday junction resolvase